MAKAVDIINEMIRWRFKEDPSMEEEWNDYSLSQPEKQRVMLYLGFTSNMVNSGVRESLCYLLKYKMVDHVVTTAGGIEADLMKCFGDFYVFRPEMSDKWLQERGLLKRGNILIPKAI